MKKNLLVIALLLTVSLVQAKKVKFSVDMTGQTISSAGIHLTGDMQDEAGFPADWEPNTIKLTQEGTSNIYSVVLDIPAFRKYEFKYLNGDLSYEVEFVPEESRVGYDFNDNRWIYIDSLSNDTQILAPLLFAGNAPASKKLVRFRINLKSEASISTNGVHVASTLNGFNYANVRMYSFNGNVFEYHGYTDSNTTIEYKYVNGNALANAETVPTACASNSNRSILVTNDVILDSICYSSCEACITGGTGIANIDNSKSELVVYPNPATNQVEISYSGTINQIIVADITGKEVKNVYYNNLKNSILLNLADLQSGMYIVSIKSGNQVAAKKIAVQN